MKRKQKIPFDILFQRRRLVKARLRRTKSGCLEYVHPQKGRIDNPTIGVLGGKSTTPLRSWIWKRHNGTLAKGKHLLMRCENRYCVEYDHMYTGDHRPRFGPSRVDYRSRFPQETIRTVLYFQHKLIDSVTSAVVKLPKHIVIGIWQAGRRRTEMNPPADWAPKGNVIQKAEILAVRMQKKIYLGPGSLKKAKADIMQSPFDLDRKRLMIEHIEGRSSDELAEKYSLTPAGALYVYRRMILNVYLKLGYRPWMRLASKGVISH